MQRRLQLQLYVYDAALESTLRFNNMQVQIPANTSNAQKAILRDLLQVVQDTLHLVNPYVQDFVQSMEMPEEALGQGKIFISSKGPTNELGDPLSNSYSTKLLCRLSS